MYAVKGFGIINKTEDILWNSLAFSMIQWMLAIWFLVPLSFLIQLEHLEVQFTYCWSLARRNLEIIFLVCEMSAVVQYFEYSLALPFFGIRMKTDFSFPVATADFSKFAGILSAALWQHYLLGFEIAPLEFHHFH